MSSYQEHKTNYQVNLNWGETFNMTVKAPAVSNRIFDTFDDAQAYVDDFESNSTEGVRITVLNDNDEDKNGVYYVESVGDGEIPGVLVKIGGIYTGIYCGDAVSINNLYNFNYERLKNKDIYINKNTLDLFQYNKTLQKWEFVCNLIPRQIDYGKYYFILSRDSVNHPVFNVNTWSETIPDVNDLPVADRDGQWYLWTRYYFEDEDGIHPKYTCAIISSSLNMGTFSLSVV